MDSKTDLELLEEEREKSATLQAQLESKDKDLAAANQLLEEQNAKVETLTKDNAELSAAVAAAAKEKAELEAAKGELSEKVKELSSKIERAASHGVTAPATDAPKREARETAPEMTFAAFNALSHGQRNAFIRSGGKIKS